MSKESELDTLVSILHEKRDILDAVGSDGDPADASQAYLVAVSNVVEFKRYNMPQILKERKAK
jgi:hypothetical protein